MNDPRRALEVHSIRGDVTTGTQGGYPDHRRAVSARGKKREIIDSIIQVSEGGVGGGGNRNQRRRARREATKRALSRSPSPSSSGTGSDSDDDDDESKRATAFDRIFGNGGRINTGDGFPSTSGIAGDEIPDDEPFGKDWQDLFRLRAQHFYSNWMVHFITLVASHLAKSGSALRENSEGAALLNNLGELANIIRERHAQLEVSRQANDRVIERSRGLGAAANVTFLPPAENVPPGTAPTVQGPRQDIQVTQTIPGATGRHLPRKFNQQQLLEWLLESGSTSATDLAIAKDLFKATKESMLEWLLHPLVSGLVPVSEELRGAISYSLMQVREDLGSGGPTVSAAYLIEEYPDQFAYIVAHRMKVSLMSRFLLPVDLRRLEERLTASVAKLAAKLMPPGQLAWKDRQIVARKNQYLPKFMLKMEGGGGTPSAIDRLLFGDGQ